MSKQTFKLNQSYICTNSTSPGYKLNQTYTTYANDAGLICMCGSDGHEDICSMLVSSFRECGK